MKRRDIIFLVFMLVVGFAAVSATFVINSNINLSFDKTSFTSSIVFTNAKTLDGTVTISSDEQNINFETKKLENVGDTAVIDFEVVNKSQEYDASVTINCGLKDNYSSFNDYLSITTNIINPFELNSGTIKYGKVTIKLKEVYTESEATPELTCTLIASPVSRETIGEKYLYKDVILNGADPVLDREKLIPITIANDGTVTYADTEKEWYNYKNKEWANAVILVDSLSQNYGVGDKIKEADIESYFVWIPRYRYQIFNKGEYTTIETTSKPENPIAKEIQIVFENNNTETSTGNKEGEWLTHPAFTNYDTNGIWVGKFETGYKGATSPTEAEQNVDDHTKVIIKPNVFSWRNISVSNMFKSALFYADSSNSHMMRNTEWGAVAYLSHSEYGINDEIRVNNNQSFLTGNAANEKDAGGSTTNNSRYNTEIGYFASTTGNITGIYDMNGGAFEQVAGYMKDILGDSGFTTNELSTEIYSKHIDMYANDSTETAYNKRILGDATGEMGPFYYATGGWRINNWYNDGSHFIDQAKPWFTRGGNYGNGPYAGQFQFNRNSGGIFNTVSFRITLAPS